MKFNEVIWFQATEEMETGELIVIIEDPEIRKFRDGDVFPHGMVLSTHYQTKFVSGDRVPVELLFANGRLMKTIKIRDNYYYKGERRENVQMPNLS